MSDDVLHPTHAHLDGELHKVHQIEEHPNGPAHTHRVHFACGLRFDIDVGGVRKHAIMMNRAEEHRMGGHLQHYHEHLKLAQQKLDEGEDWSDDRWRRHGDQKVATCAACAAYENGASPFVPEMGHNPPTTVLADIPTGMKCRYCAGDVYKRRKTGEYTCNAAGHPNNIEELISQAHKNFETLMAAIKEG